jgi:phage baseplate assembly protein W
MASYGVKLPLTYDSGDGFTMLKRIKEVAKQNFKMLILTVPGERVMVPNFGVGLKKYLFENFSDSVYAEIDSKIREQVSIYMPAIAIDEIEFGATDQDNNHLAVFISYRIPAIAESDLLEFTI